VDVGNLSVWILWVLQRKPPTLKLENLFNFYISYFLFYFDWLKPSWLWV